MKYSDIIDEALSLGFQTVYSEDFVGHFGPKSVSYADQLQVMCHPTLGILLLVESYNWNNLNRAVAYFNWQSKDWQNGVRPLALRGSGHIWSNTPMNSTDTSDWVWVGSFGVTSDNQLTEYIREAKRFGKFLKVWVEPQFFHFENYSEKPYYASNDVFSLSEKTWEKINKFPKWAKDIFMPGMIKHRLTQTSY